MGPDVSLPGTRGRITPVEYRAASGYALGVEVFPAAELRRRVSEVPGRAVERVDLLCLLYVASGHYTHMVDFETHRCSAGSVLTVQPGQVHRFGTTTRWDGWFVVARSEHTGERALSIAGGVGDPSALAVHVKLDASDGRVIDDTLRQMADDARRESPESLVDALLVHQLHGLVVRVQLGNRTHDAIPALDPVVSQRFSDFRDEVERAHARWHAVGPYARRMGYSERSLTRATEAVAGLSAKAFITRRIVLEAKRLLAHTSDPVATIAHGLGFDEPTNFVKYFRRETGVTPGAFRSGVDASVRAHRRV